MIVTQQKGLGSGASIAPIVSSAGNIAAGVVPGVLVGTGAFAAGSLAVPLIGAGIAAVTLVVSLWLNKNKVYFGEEKATTQIVNQAETYLQQNLSAWQALSSMDKTLVNQTQALANFDNIWGQVVQACSSNAYSQGADSTGLSPGARCVADRSGLAHGGNGKYDWFAYYRDPIANDTIYTPPVTTSIDNAVSNVTGNVSSVISGDGRMGVLVIPALLLGGLVWALGEL